MSHVALISLVASTCLALAIPAAAAPAHSKPTKKVDWSQNLASALVLNRVDQYASLYQACQQSDFRSLARALYNARKHISRDKTEYESDAAFAAVKAKAEELINGGGRLVVCQPLDDNEDAPFRYDANREAFSGEFVGSQTVWREYKRTGSYVGQTAMGARTKVRTGSEVEYNVNLQALAPVAPDAECREYDQKPGCRIIHADAASPAECLYSSYGTCRYEVPAPRADAPSLKANGYLVFVGKLNYPFIVDVGLDGDPTFSDPQDIYKLILVVHFAPEEIAVVDPGGVKWTYKLPIP